MEEARETAMIFDQVSYNWVGKYGLLAEIEGAVKYLALIRKNYILPVRPKATDPKIVNTSLIDKQARALQELDHNKKADYAAVESFRQAFSKNARKAFNQRYYEQLRGYVFQYKCITPQKFIEHLEKKWVKLDTMAIKRLHDKYFCSWDAKEEHIVSFKVRLNRKQKTYSKYRPP